ncbi:MAG: UDP-glucose/GDP-mannose dehydrogenase family protein [Zetaproteobacteria bacterium]|nr:MAG: UDP-glucose/GDP-mannose dehydrogenase family protein [Zetaproteobacteria bacterium]
MSIAVIGTGYVGLVTAACLAEVGQHVWGIDCDREKLAGIEEGIMPIHEPGLDEIVMRNLRNGRLKFTHDYAEGLADAEIIFLAVGTPPEEDGSADLTHVLEAAREAALHVGHSCLLVTKSTVPVGTGEKVEQVVSQALADRGSPSIEIHVASNPEFLREGQAVGDFLKPDRIIVGVRHEEDVTVFRRLYAPFNRNRDRLLIMDRRSAEITKYAANAMLATRISFMNEMARLCDAVGGDIEAVRKGLGSDPRIGPHFLYAGIGYGGSCFPKDIKALRSTGASAGVPLRVIDAVHEVNEQQRLQFAERVAQALRDVDEPRVALWGLAFKPGTDDMREAPSRIVVDRLLADGVRIRAHDPAAMGACRKIWPEGSGIDFVATPEACLPQADALVVVTEWLCFREPDWDEVERLMRGRLLFDGRNLYEPEEMRRRGWQYMGIGRGRWSQ